LKPLPKKPIRDGSRQVPPEKVPLNKRNKPAYVISN